MKEFTQCKGERRLDSVYDNVTRRYERVPSKKYRMSFGRVL